MNKNYYLAIGFTAGLMVGLLFLLMCLLLVAVSTPSVAKTVVPTMTNPPTYTALPTASPVVLPTETVTPFPAIVPSPAHPAGASALCNDGTYSYSTTRSGTCSGHGGVYIWLP